MSAIFRRDSLQFLGGFEMIAQFGPALSGFQVVLVVKFKGFHHGFRAASRVAITNFATFGSLDARGPAASFGSCGVCYLANPDSTLMVKQTWW